MPLRSEVPVSLYSVNVHEGTDLLRSRQGRGQTNRCRDSVPCTCQGMGLGCAERLHGVPHLRPDPQNSRPLRHDVNVSVSFVSVPRNASSVKTSLIRSRLDFLVGFFVEADGEAAVFLGTAFGLGELRNLAIAVSRSDILTVVCGIILSLCSSSSLALWDTVSLAFCKILPDGSPLLIIVPTAITVFVAFQVLEELTGSRIAS